MPPGRSRVGVTPVRPITVDSSPTGQAPPSTTAIPGPRLSRTCCAVVGETRSEEHTSELQSLMRISYAVFCLNKKSMIYSRYSFTLAIYRAQLYTHIDNYLTIMLQL